MLPLRRRALNRLRKWRNTRAGVALLVLACALPPLVLTWLVWRFAVDLPLIDQWLFLDHMDKLIRGSWSWQDIWAAHNGHRLVLARLILVPLGILTGWNTRVEMGLNLALAMSYALILAVGFRRLSASRDAVCVRWFAVGTSLCVFSPNQYANWLGGQQTQLFVSMVLVAAGLVVLDRPDRRWTRLGIAAGFGCAASLGQAVGLAFWPASAWMIWRQCRDTDSARSAIARYGPFAAWTAVALGFVAIYFYPAPGDADFDKDVSTALHPAAVFRWMARHAAAPLFGLGRPLHAMPDLLWTGALLLLVATFAIARATLRARSDAGVKSQYFAEGLALFSLTCLALTALARVDIGGLAPIFSKYLIFATPLSLTVAFWCCAQADELGWRLQLRRAAVGGFAALAAATWCTNIDHFSARRDALEPRVTLLRTDGHPALPAYHPTEQQLRLARDYEFSLFRDHPRIAVADGAEGPIAEFVQRLALTSGETPALDLTAGWPAVVLVRATNASAVHWPSIGGSRGPGPFEVRLASSWLATDGTMLARDGRRTRLPHAVEPGESVDLALCVDPPTPGRYLLRISMLQEGVAWFDEAGSPGLDVPVDVSGPAALGSVRRHLGRASSLLGLRPC